MTSNIRDFGRYNHDDESYSLVTVDLDTALGLRLATYLDRTGYSSYRSTRSVTKLSPRLLFKVRRWEREVRRGLAHERPGSFLGHEFVRFSGGYFVRPTRFGFKASTLVL